jgi:hypothetical protein
MANIAWDVIPTYATVASGATNSTSFVVPRGALAMTIITPAITNTYKLQTLSSLDLTTWTDLKFVSDAGAAVALAGFAQSTAIVFSYEQFGAGNLRIVESAAANQLDTFVIMFSRSE